MKKLTKNQKQLLILGGLIAAILATLAIFVFRPTPPPPATVVTKTIDPRIPEDLVKSQAYRSLRLQADLPLVPGMMGRNNPFEPYQ